MPASLQPSPSRRGFLRGRPAAPPQPRPPGAVEEALFIDRCTRCTDCIAACPEQVLRAGDGGFPLFDAALGECTFCGDCTRACGEHALRAERLPEWPWRAALGSGCLGAEGVVCQSCRDACGPRAIRFAAAAAPSPPHIDTASCTGCGACVAACPVSAIGMARPRSGTEAT